MTAIIAREAKIELSQEEEQIQRWSTLIPDIVLKTPPGDLQQPQNVTAVLLNVDISGLIPLCEQYNKISKYGLKRLSATLNSYIGTIVEAISYYGGDIVQFSYEGLVAVWRVPPNAYLHQVIHQTVVCALLVHETSSNYKTEVGVILTIKIGISCGNVEFVVIGNGNGRHWVIGGSPVDDIRNAQRVSLPGDVVLSTSAWTHLSDEWYVVTYADNHVKVHGHNVPLNKDAVRVETPHRHKQGIDMNLNRLSPFILPFLRCHLYKPLPLPQLTEIKEITVQYINIALAGNLMASINRLYQIVYDMVHKVHGTVINLSAFDKNLFVLVGFGFHAVDYNVHNGDILKAAHTIRKVLLQVESVLRVSVGIASGLAYCGIVGHPLRNAYMIIGSPVDKAAQMMYTYSSKVVCEYDTYLTCKLCSSHFRLQFHNLTEDHIFEYNEDFIENVDKNQTTVIGRQTEIDLLSLIVENPDRIGGYHGICFRGGTKIGKTQILHRGLNKYRKMMYVAAIDLQGGIQKPYFCISATYKQLYDLAALEQPTAIVDLPRHLWNYNDMLEENTTKNRSKLAQYFSKLCRTISKLILLFIDNVQYIDAKSFQMLDAALKTDNFRLICAGDFDNEGTWDNQWKISLSNQIKLFDVQPLNSDNQLKLICDYMNVIGIQAELYQLIGKVSDGRPGYMHSCLDQLVNNGDLEVQHIIKNQDYMFRYDIAETSKVPVAHFSNEYHQTASDTTLQTMSLDLISYMAYQEQIVINRASLLGPIFTKTILMKLLPEPDEVVVAVAIKNLFQREIFRCASKYLRGCFFQNQNECSCVFEEEIHNNSMSTVCELIHFKNMDLKRAAYDSIEDKKQWHLKITDLLDCQNNLCPNCARQKFSPIISTTSFNDTMQGEVGDYTDCASVSTARSKKTIQVDLGASTARTQAGDQLGQTYQIRGSNPKLWDPTCCFCLELTTNLYRDLIYHSDRAEHLPKRIFYMFQYAFVLTKTNELDEAVPILNETSELCLRVKDHSDNFTRVMMRKVHTLLAEIYYKLGNLRSAKDHFVISLRQYEVPMISFNHDLPQTIINRTVLFTLDTAASSLDNDVAKWDFGMVLKTASSIFAAEGNWTLAKLMVSRSLYYLRTTSSMDVLCHAYSLAIDIYSYCGTWQVCTELTKRFNEDIAGYHLKKFEDIYALNKLMYSIFQSKVLRGHIGSSIRQGFKVLDMSTVSHAHHLQLQFIPLLLTLLIMVQRIDEAVYLGRMLSTIGKKYEHQGLVAYYAFCMELIVETNFFLEPLEEIERFVKYSYGTDHDHVTNTHLDNKLLIYLYQYRLKKSPTPPIWTRLYNWENDDGMLSANNLLKCTECFLLELVHSSKITKKFHTDKALLYLNRCKIMAKKWNLYKPRYLHCRAYLARIENNKSKCIKNLRRAYGFAREQGNVLEQCWITMHLNCWSGGFSFIDNGAANSVANWNSANTYTAMQWSQILNGWPL